MSETLPPAVADLLSTFATDYLPDGTQGVAYQNLVNTLGHSPLVVQQLDEAIGLYHARQDKGENPVGPTGLYRLELLEDNAAEGGHFSRGIIRLPQHLFMDPNAKGQLVQVIGHETSHALFDQAKYQAARQQFEDIKLATLLSQQMEHDYTEALRPLKDVYAENESRAEIAGWNALVDSVRQNKPDATLQDIAKKAGNTYHLDSEYNGIKTIYSPNIDFTFNPDHSLADTPENLQAMIQHYYNSPMARLGPSGNADYTNAYLVDHVANICELEISQIPNNPERADIKIMFDMQSLGLNEGQLEGLGFRLVSGTQCRYFDTADPDTPRYFDHTHDHPRRVPNQPDGTPLPAPARQPDSDQGSFGAREREAQSELTSAVSETQDPARAPSAANNATAEKLARLSERIDEQMQQHHQFDDLQGEERQNFLAAGALAVMQKVGNRLDPDQVNIGIVARNTNADGNMAFIDIKPAQSVFINSIEQTKQQPAEDSLTQAQELVQQQEQVREQERQQAHLRQVNDQQAQREREGPGM